MSLRAPRLSSRPSTSLFLGLALMTLAGCGGQSTATPQGQAHAVGAPQALYDEQQEPTGPFAGVTPLELKPGGSLGSLGLNLQPLFAEDLKSPTARLDRLEATVLAIQSDLQTLAPSMQRMAVVENDLAAAVQELREILVQQNAQIATAPAVKTEPKKVIAPKPTPVVADKAVIAPAPAPAVTTSQTDATGAILPATPVAKAPDAAPVAETATTAPATADNTIQALRLGEHPGKTRVVLDVTQKPTFRTDLDNNEKLLIIEIDNATWNGKIPAALSSTLVQSYSTQALDNNAGTRIILMLKKPVKIGQASILGPDSTRGPHRLVLDLNAL